MTVVGPRTNLLVVAGPRPFSFGIERSAAYRRAESLISMGRPLRIVCRDGLRDMLAETGG
jgi:hypothetical protein